MSARSVWPRVPPRLSGRGFLARDDAEEALLARQPHALQLQQVPPLLRGQLEDFRAHVTASRRLDHVPAVAVRDRLVLHGQDTRDGANPVANGGRGAPDPPPPPPPREEHPPPPPPWAPG